MRRLALLMMNDLMLSNVMVCVGLVVEFDVDLCAVVTTRLSLTCGYGIRSGKAPIRL